MLEPGGLAVIRGPDLDSLKAIVTRWTPHAFHVFYCRRVLGLRGAGRKGQALFPVEHAADASIVRLRSLLERAGLRAAFKQSYVGDQLTVLRDRLPPAYHAYNVVSRALRFFTAGRMGVLSTDFVIAYLRA